MKDLQTIKEEFTKDFPDLKWSTTGGTKDISDWWLKVIKERDEEIIKEILMQGRENKLTSFQTTVNQYIRNRAEVLGIKLPPITK